MSWVSWFVSFLTVFLICSLASANACPPGTYDCVDCGGVACTSNCAPGEGKKEVDGRITAYEWPLEDAGKCRCYCPWRSKTATTSYTPTTRYAPTTTTQYEAPWVEGDGNSKCETSIGENCRNSIDCGCLQGQKCEPTHPKAAANGCVSAIDLIECPPNSKAYGKECYCIEGHRWMSDKSKCVPKRVESCDNDEDDDGDGFTDCADAGDCADDPACAEICDNGEDDDGDGLVDCLDVENCLDDPACAEVCDNGVDDNENKLIDCEDTYYCKSDPACKYVVTGDVIDGFGHPLKKVYVGLLLGDEEGKGLWASNYTDENGKFELDYTEYMINYLSTIDPTEPEKKQLGSFNIVLYDEDGRLEILYDKGGVGESFYADTKDFEFPTKSNYIIWLNEKDPYIESYSGMSDDPEVLWGAGYDYYLLEKVFTFTEDKLDFSFTGSGNSLPIKAYIYSSETDSAFYSPKRRGGGIFMSPDDSKHDNTQNPENGIWHEFFHAAMYNQYGSWSSYGSLGENHEGFKNDNTGDSFEEAFAEYWPNIVSRELDGDEGGLYAGIWNMELNYKPWDKAGKYEEFAVATMLWDLTDSKSDKGDTLSLEYRDLWDVLMSSPHRNVKEVYDALTYRWPDKSTKIDELFVAHGLFKDTNPGNDIYDFGEPFWDKNKNRRYNSGEIFIDIGTPDIMNRTYQIYDPENDTIGTASNYERPDRLRKPFINSFISTDVKSNGKEVADAVYKVIYTFGERELDYETYGYTDPSTGYVFVEIPPGDYDAVAEISVDNYEGGNKTTLTSADYNNPQSAERGYMKSATFKVGDKKPNYCRSSLDCDTTQTCVENNCVEEGDDEVGGDVCCILGVLSVPAIAVLTVAAIVFSAAVYIKFIRKK